MAIGNVLKKIVGVPVGAAATIGRSLANEVAPGTFAGPPQPSGVLNPVPPSAAPAEDEMPMFELPELSEDDPDYEEKMAIHNAYSRLAEIAQEGAAEEGIDFRSKYKEMADFIASKPEPRRWSPLSAFAIGMGNPGALNAVAATNKAADTAREDRDDEIARIQEEAIKGEISQLLAQKNFKKALTQSKLLADLAVVQDRLKSTREHKNKLAEIEATNKGKADVARIKAASAEKTIDTRTRMMIEKYKLNAAQARELMKMAGAFTSGLQRQTDAAGEPYYTVQEVESVLYRLVDWADDQDIEEPGVAGTKPAAPPAARPAAGPQKNDSVAEAFAKRRAARAAAQK